MRVAVLSANNGSDQWPRDSRLPACAESPTEKLVFSGLAIILGHYFGQEYPAGLASTSPPSRRRVSAFSPALRRGSSESGVHSPLEAPSPIWSANSVTYRLFQLPRHPQRSPSHTSSVPLLSIPFSHPHTRHNKVSMVLLVFC